MATARWNWPRKAGLALLLAAAAAFVWPLHAIATRIHPLILGIPFSLAWIILGQLAVFLGLLLLFLTED